MKIAIQGHPIRGHEVIQILESLGGKNDRTHKGDNPNCYYELHGGYIWCVETKSQHIKYYTLEEFEKEFPFKIGDRVISITTNLRGIITNFKENGWYYVKCDNGNFVCIFGHHLKLYKEMKKERNITLTLDKAKEWYKKGGELKEVALQAFTEEELIKAELPKTWKEFCAIYPIQNGEAIIDDVTSQIRTYKGTVARNLVEDKNICPSIKSAEAHLAMIQLEQLRDCWRQGWEPDWNDAKQAKFYICYYQGKFKISTLYETKCFLSFPTREMAEEFLKCFRDLIEKAGDLI